MRHKVHSYLKGLAETRARAAGDIARFERITEEVAAKLAEARSVLDSCDRLIKRYNPELQPELIGPIRIWPNHGGKRGELRSIILEFMERHAPDEVTTMEICNELETRWHLNFLTPMERDKWRRDSVGRCMRRLAEEERVTPLHDASGADPMDTGRWVLVAR
jgi:hypothetical protein